MRVGRLEVDDLSPTGIWTSAGTSTDGLEHQCRSGLYREKPTQLFLRFLTIERKSVSRERTVGT